MRISIAIRDVEHLGGCETLTEVYVNNDLVLTESNPSIYDVLFALTNSYPARKLGITLNPLLVYQELEYTGEQYLGEEYAV